MAQITRLREIIQGPGIGIAPGAHDVLSAKLIEQAGFPAIFAYGVRPLRLHPWPA